MYLRTCAYALCNCACEHLSFLVHTNVCKRFLALHTYVMYICLCTLAFQSKSTLAYVHILGGGWTGVDFSTYVQPIAFGVSFLQSRNSFDHLVLHVSFGTFR